MENHSRDPPTLQTGIKSSYWAETRAFRGLLIAVGYYTKKLERELKKEAGMEEKVKSQLVEEAWGLNPKIWEFLREKIRENSENMRGS